MKLGYKKTVPDTYWERLKQMTSSSSKKQSKYAIQPILQKMDEGRGKKVFYSLTKNAKIRYDLQLPIFRTESKNEMAYRLLFYYIVFFYNQRIKLKDEQEYNELLEKLRINKNKLGVLNSDFKEFKITKWTHPSDIEFTRKEFHLHTEKEGRCEYFYMLPGISPFEFKKIKESPLSYEQLNFTKNEVTQYFELLEKQNLIKKIKLKELVYLDEQRYKIKDDSFRELLADCWTLQSHVLIYFEYIWKVIHKPEDEERIWHEHLWGKNRSNKWFIECNNTRREYQRKNNNHILKETKDRIEWEKSEIIKKFESMKKAHTKTINDYSYFIDPLLNVVYPRFLRKEFNNKAIFMAFHNLSFIPKYNIHSNFFVES
jgi:hypothetical protein